jgi:tRNA C32,U32 (ribose-2'-O)-methylase TrmJ
LASVISQPSLEGVHVVAATSARSREMLPQMLLPRLAHDEIIAVAVAD